MNILYLHCTADLYGASRCMLYVIERQIQEGHRVCVIIPFDGKLRPSLERLGAEVRIVPYDPSLRKTCVRSPIRFAKFIRDIICSLFVYTKIAQQFHADLIHTNTSVTIPGGIVARRLKIPHICHVRESYEGFSWVWNVYRHFILHFSDRLVCVSESIAGMFADRDISSGQVVMIYDGIPPMGMKGVDLADVQRFKDKYGLSGHTLAGLAGRIILRRKGQDIFVKAVALLKDKHPNARFLIIGGTYPGNEYHLEQLKELITQLDINDQVVLVGEIDDMAPVYAALDISVMASAMPEPFGLVTVESMAFGKPVVGTNIGGTPELVKDEVTGILVPPDNEVAMAEALGRLLDDPVLRQKMGDAGKKRVGDKFGADVYYRNVMSLYRELVG